MYKGMFRPNSVKIIFNLTENGQLKKSDNLSA